MWKVKRNEYRTHCGSGHRHRRRRHCRISRQRIRRQACAGPAGRAAANRRYSRRQIGYRPWPLGQAGRSAMADLAGRDRQQQLHQPRQQGRRHQGNHGLHRARAVHRGRTDSRTEAGEGRRLRLHGGDPARRLPGHLHRNFAGNRRRRLHPAERPRRRASYQAREESGQGKARTSPVRRSSSPMSAFSRSTRRRRKKKAPARWSAGRSPSN